MSLGTWLKKSWSVEQPPEKNESVMVTESLMMELDFQMREASERAQRLELEEKRKHLTGVDYSWLLNPQATKAYEMPQLERLELEDLGMKVKPTECGRVITAFRSSVAREPPVEEIPRILRAVICQVLEGRPKEETMPEWISRSLSSLSKSVRPSARVMPINTPEDSDLEMQGSESSSTASPRPTNDHTSVFTQVDNLPV